MTIEELQGQTRTLRAQGKGAEALVLCRQFLKTQPDSARAWMLLGGIQADLGQLHGALDSYRRAAALSPADASVPNAMGVVHQRLRNFPKALECYDAAHRLDGGNPLYPHNIGRIMHGLGRYDQSIQCQVAALTLSPNFADAFLAMGASLVNLGRFEEAELAFGRVLKLRPQDIAARLEIANCHLECGRFEAALSVTKEALNLRPDDIRVRVSQAFLSSYLPLQDEATAFELHRDCGSRVASVCGSHAPHDNDTDPDRVLRVGLVSDNFRRHPVGYFLDAFVRHHDAKQFELHVYSMTLKGDSLTRRLHDSVHSWNEVAALDSEQLADKVRRDSIDLLIDLSGYENWKQLPVFARRPAPVQISWLGYFNTTGLGAMDYFVSDEVSTPDDTTQIYSEKLVRLPVTRFCYTPPDYAPEVAPLPAKRNGYVTFGSFNKIAKLNDGVIEAWSRILNQCPGSRLLLKGKALNDKVTRDWFEERFAQHGIDASRLMLREFSRDHRQMLEEYADMDISLDPFPFTGALTTCEAMWMGVPTVSKAGRSLVSRQGTAMLKAVGLADFCAESDDEYVGRALCAARNIEALAGLRSGLRNRMRDSPLCDGALFAQRMENALRKMWRDGCRSSKSAKNSATFETSA